MQTATFLTFSAAILAAGVLNAQTPGDQIIEPVMPPSGETPALPGGSVVSPPVAKPAISAVPVAEDPDIPSSKPIADEALDSLPVSPQQAAKQDFVMTDLGVDMTETGLNDLFLLLAKSAKRQYFFNPKISGPEFLVTGHLNNENPNQQMEDLALQFGLTLHTNGNTIYALTKTQLDQLPSREFHYQLRYLRPTDIDSIKQLIKPILSASGMVTFEPKTNTVIIIDSAHRITQAQTLLSGIDKAKAQIIIEVKILRINSTAAERTGIDWASSLGKTGASLDLSRDLNSVFGLPSKLPSVSEDGMNLVLTPLQLSGVLRALAEGGLASQESNPSLITEDNEQANISIIDRIPILTTTTTAASAGAAPTISEQVRYKIDNEDQSIAVSPERHREIGISMSVTPTILPDGTVRMSMRPRSAQVAEYIISARTGNQYPRVTESMLETIARVPDGHSLVVGGFFGETKGSAKTKVPLLGDLPLMNFFFKSKELTQEKNSLVFVVTPQSYDPTKRGQAQRANRQVRDSASLPLNHDWLDQDNPGPSHEPNLKRSLRGLQPSQAPFYPSQDELGDEKPPNPTAPTPNPKVRFGKGGKR